jgi:threonine/homoserine/homoserine lactone efflux protein
VDNPKETLFFMALLPQFADPDSPGGAALQLLTLGLCLAFSDRRRPRFAWL